MHFRHLIVAVLVGLSSPAFAVEPVRNQRDDIKATTEALGSVDRNAGWCDDAVSGGASNIWASSNIPAEIGGGGVPTAAGLLNRSYVRYLTIRIVDATDSALPICARLGPNTDAGTGRLSLTCTGTAGAEATNGLFITKTGEGRSFLIERLPEGDTPNLFVRSASGTIRYCVEVTWHQKG